MWGVLAFALCVSVCLAPTAEAQPASDGDNPMPMGYSGCEEEQIWKCQRKAGKCFTRKFTNDFVVKKELGTKKGDQACHCYVQLIDCLRRASCPSQVLNLTFIECTEAQDENGARCSAEQCGAASTASMTIISLAAGAIVAQLLMQLANTD